MAQKPPRQSFQELIERDAQLQMLLDSFDSARQGRVNAVFITAEPGAGKTTLIQEFLSRVSSDYSGVQAISSSGQESEQEAEAYRVLLDLLEDIGDRRGGGSKLGNTSRSMMLTLLPSLASFIPIPFVSAGAQLGLTALASLLGLKNEESIKNQTTIFQAFLRRVLSVARKSPLILVLDDAQWADAPSIGAVNYMLAHAENAPIFVLVAYRSTPEPPPETALFKMKVDLDRKGKSQTIFLADFDERQTEHLVRHLMPNAFPSRFMRRLFELSGGNPLFVRLFLQLLQDKGYATRGSDGLWRLSQNVDEAIIPDTIHDIVTQRVSMMPAQSRAMCEIASVEGTRFALRVLLTLAESEERLSQAKVLRILSDVEKRFKLVSSDGVTGDLAFYRFVHGLVRDTLYMSLNQPLREYYHKRIAETLEQAAKNAGEALAFDIATHFQSGKEPARALPYWIQAAKAQRATYAVTEAALSFGSAVACADEVLARLAVDDPKYMEIERQKAIALSGQAESYGVKAFTVQALQAATEAATLWHRLGDSVQETLALHRAALCYHEHQTYERAVALFRQSLDIARNLENSDLIALVLRDLGNTQTAMRSFDYAQSSLTESSFLFDSTGNTSEWMVTMLCLGNCQFQQGAISDSVHTYARALEVAETIDDEYRISQILQRQGVALVATGQVDEGIAAANRAVALAEKLQIEEYRAHRLLGEALFNAEHFGQAREVFIQSITDAVDVHQNVQLELMVYLSQCVEQLAAIDLVAAIHWCKSFQDAVGNSLMSDSFASGWERARALCEQATAMKISLSGIFDGDEHSR